MPRRRVETSQERLRFVIEGSKPGSRMAKLFRELGNSRQTGYLWLKRYQEGGAAGVLSELSRRPHESPQRTSRAVVEAVREARLLRPDWGARKLARVIHTTYPTLPRMSTTTLHRVLEREGLIEARDRQQIDLQRFERTQPNELWQMDFKGPQGFNRFSPTPHDTICAGVLSNADLYTRHVGSLCVSACGRGRRAEHGAV